MSGEPRRRTDRAAYLEFVRTHHPDVGGDPEAFVAGLAEFDRADPPVRPDAPIEVVDTPSGLRGLVHRAWRWWQRRHAPPRVQ